MSMAAMLAASCSHFTPPRPLVLARIVGHVNSTPSFFLSLRPDHVIRNRGRLLLLVGGGGRRDRVVPAVGGDFEHNSDVDQEDSAKSADHVWRSFQMNACQMREKVSKLGRAGLLAYGLFSGVIYTTFFFIAFLAFEKSTGQNPANNLKGCLAGMVTMWTGNNFTRPLRVAGAAAMAPLMDKVLKKTQQACKFKDEASAFLFLVVLLFAICGASVGLLILSRVAK